MTSSPRILREVLLVWLVTLVVIRVIVTVADAGAPEWLKAAVPLLFMYVPVWWMRRLGRDPDEFPLALPAFSDRQPYINAVKLNLVVIGVILLPWLLGYHFWQTEGLPAAMRSLGFSERVIPHYQFEGIWPSSPVLLVAYHLFFVAIPEEMFYRGYVQSRLDELWPPKWTIWGAEVGWGLVVGSLIFAVGHSLVTFQWWHPFIFFPSLVFGWMRARTGTVVAGALFHAWSNVQVTTLDTLYGIVPP